MPKHKKQDTFLVNVTILEGRHYALANMNSYVHIRVDHFTKTTRQRYHTDCPYYNEYFVFEFTTDLQTLLDKNITLTVFRPRSIIRLKKTLGYCTLDIGTVWEQPEHQFFRKWAILSSTKSNFTGPSGYLKVTLSILARGETPKIPLVDPDEDDVIEGNLLLPEGLTLERQRAQFIFKVYKGLDMFKHSYVTNTAVADHNKPTVDEKRQELPNVSVQISFAGMKARTKVQKHTSTPNWNESLTIAELFPPLCQRIKIQLYYTEHLKRKVQSIKYLNMLSISNDKEFGFLPMFGPAFIHFYRKTAMGEAYAGKILISLETKIFIESFTRTRFVMKDTIPPLLETRLWRYERVLLFAVVLNVTVIEKKYSGKPISFEIKFGTNKGEKFNETIHNSLFEIAVSNAESGIPEEDGYDRLYKKRKRKNVTYAATQVSLPSNMNRKDRRKAKRRIKRKQRRLARRSRRREKKSKKSSRSTSSKSSRRKLKRSVSSQKSSKKFSFKKKNSGTKRRECALSKIITSKRSKSTSSAGKCSDRRKRIRDKRNAKKQEKSQSTFSAGKFGDCRKRIRDKQNAKKQEKSQSTSSAGKFSDRRKRMADKQNAKKQEKIQKTESSISSRKNNETRKIKRIRKTIDDTTCSEIMTDENEDYLKIKNPSMKPNANASRSVVCDKKIPDEECHCRYTREKRKRSIAQIISARREKNMKMKISASEGSPRYRQQINRKRNKLETSGSVFSKRSIKRRKRIRTEEDVAARPNKYIKLKESINKLRDKTKRAIRTPKSMNDPTKCDNTINNDTKIEDLYVRKNVPKIVKLEAGAGDSKPNPDQLRRNKSNYIGQGDATKTAPSINELTVKTPKPVSAKSSQHKSDTKHSKSTISKPKAQTVSIKEALTLQDRTKSQTIASNMSTKRKSHKTKSKLSKASTRNTDELEEIKYAIPSNASPEYQPVSKDHQFWHVNFGDSVPCIFKTAAYPDLRRRLYNANLLERIAHNMKEQLIEIELLFVHDEFISKSQIIEEKMVNMLDYVSSACRKYIDIVAPTSHICITTLDREKLRWGLREMEFIEESCIHLYNPRTKKKSFRKAEKICRRLEILIDHPQECWPDVFLWMNCGKDKAANMRIPAKDLVYSVVNDEKGKYCGNVQNLFFKANKRTFSEIACKIEIFLWMGLERHKDECFKAIPKGYSMPNDLPEGEIPRYLLMTNVVRFQCRAHIYQGRFNFAHDRTGFSDLFAKVIICEETRTTKVVKATLNPMWDQTLYFKEVTVYGTNEQITRNPPMVLVQIADRDKCCQVEYIGRCTITPCIKFKNTAYTLPNFPPKLQWYKIENKFGKEGEILAAIELLEIDDDDPDMQSQQWKYVGRGIKKRPPIVSIPIDIKPVLIQYRMEALFWGMRNLKKIYHIPINKPKITLECINDKLHSETILNAREDTNFTGPIKTMDLKLPNKEEYVPPLSIKLYDYRSFGRYTYAGSNLSYIQQFLYHPVTKTEWDKRMLGIGMKSYDSLESKADSDELRKIMLQKQTAVSIVKLKAVVRKRLSCKECLKRLFGKRRKKHYDISLAPDMRPSIADDSLDWWSKYYSSIEDPEKVLKLSDTTTTIAKSKKSKSKKADPIPAQPVVENKNFRLKIYDNELEKQPEFNHFSDTLSKFKIYKGKTSGDDVVDDQSLTGILKGKIILYMWPPEGNVEYVTPSGHLLKDGYFQGYPLSQKESFLLRVYCVRGVKIRPKDIRGKSDSYIRILMNGRTLVNDSKNYVAKNVNPIYGRLFEFNCTFPQDHQITMQVWDWDKNTKDDLIGETKIDIENRYYTRHRANCGIQFEYTDSGCCPWRDRYKPSVILEILCAKYNIAPPEYNVDSVVVGCKSFRPARTGKDAVVKSTTYEEEISKIEAVKESMALHALHHWHEMPTIGFHLVPEHVETRSLYHPASPGIEQGKLLMWIDIFLLSHDVPPPMAVKIQPRKPIKYELRVTIWNVEDVILADDDFFLGERKSDIYVKGWLSRPDVVQKTDVHYRSMTGEGNFNWRFVFPFEYLSTENKLIVHKKDTVFDIDETELKIPCKLKLQVWDNDIFTPDDFLGTLTLELNKIPRGAKIPKQCTMKILDRSAPTVNIFHIRRMRAWWPFVCMAKGTNEYEQTGKLDAEFELVTAEEAGTDPVGLGRADPHALPPPNRPEMSFAWFRNPLKTFKYIIWKGLKWKIIKALVIILILLFFALMVYSLPREFTSGLMKSLGAKYEKIKNAIKASFKGNVLQKLFHLPKSKKPVEKAAAPESSDAD